MVFLRIGESIARVPDAVIELARQRCLIDQFIVRSASDVNWEIEVAPASEYLEAQAVDAVGIPFRLSISDSRIRVEQPRSALQAELVLRLLFHLEVTRQGGLLLHSSGVSFSGLAVVATGPSGAGKSTFAALCASQSGVGLLSDEIVAVFPTGHCFGTPFRSTLETAGTPERFALKGLLTLTKGREELIAPKAPARAVADVMAQVYRSPIQPLPIGEILRRVSAIVETIGVRELTFRRHPAVAGFIRDWLTA